MMAAKESSSGGINRDELDDITTCCICTEVYTDPKALPCIHTFCMKCIQETGLKKSKGPGDEMPCPICRRLFKIPTEGYSGLPKNFFIERLILLSKVSDPSDVGLAKELCSLCLEESDEQTDSETPTADKYCVDCKHKLCEECCSEHKKFKLTKNHKLIPINEQRVDQNSMVEIAQNGCEIHEQQVLNIFCDHCKTVVCAVCFIEEHDNHKNSHVNKCLDGFRKQIESNTKAINGCIAEAHMRKAEIMKVKEEMQQRVESLESDVERRKEEIKQLTNKHASCLLQSLYSERQGRLKEIQMVTDDIDAYLSNLESYNSYCQRLMDKGSSNDICRAISDLLIRALELQQQCQPTVERRIMNFKYCFRQSALQDFLQDICGNLVGEIVGNQRFRYDPVLVHTIAKKGVHGLTILDKELFVVSDQSSEVEVYDSTKFSFSRRWASKELFNLLDIASCNGNKCLYVIDCEVFGDKSSEIFRVDTNGELITKWSTGRDYGCLSVTVELTVILTVYSAHTLNEYSPDGQMIRELDLSSTAGIFSPSHAIKLTNGHFVVCEYNCELHRVCLVDEDGKLNKSYSGKCESTIGQLNGPVHLTVDSKGFVMVADQLNGRIVMLDSNLEYERDILSKEKHGLRHPWRILLDESNGRLFVADNQSCNQRILIFEFK